MKKIKMPGPITHIVLSEKIFDKYFPKKNRRDFLVGTSLPDIRYFGNVDREKTHQSAEDFTELLALNSFDAGLKFHSFVDFLWTDFFQRQSGYPFFREPVHLTVVSLKFLADEIHYDLLDNWSRLESYFDLVLGPELKFDTATELARWHNFLKKYFAHKPTDQSRSDFIKAEGFQEPFKMANQFVAELRKKSEIVGAILKFYDDFETLVVS